ncbi:aminoacyl-histidine dipeptidase [Chlorobium sp. N1]|uniref:aminoacyl-histidine dipeptidase n=1 Tax=Chlorobium sp. N1 TaxID=2491138 RepID=UPI00103F6576|nr:aminoacyl-histidine dipeptidase [Chlorobium sp. N1]TCD47244.1 aminoacyl-histidine dipeptidase [Chlorobium sp. N1]
MHCDLLELEPRPLWRHFHRLTLTPRPSGHEEAVRALVTGFARDLGLEAFVDRAGNVVVRKPATPGMESRPGVVLQAHLDMVPQQNAGGTHDFVNDPIEAYVDGDRVRARGTTLGADNGIGVAAILAVLESDSIVHGPLEALFTANEEAGMTGALGLEAGTLRGSCLLNLDSEDEGELFIGCAGGLDATFAFSCTTGPAPAGSLGFRVRVRGLRGGHSGMDIHLGRGNANRLLARLLLAGEGPHAMRLASLEGGSLRNAIPREAEALVAVPEEAAEGFRSTLGGLASSLRLELEAADPGLQVEILPAAAPERVMEGGAASRLLKAIDACPNGVSRMSAEMEGLVESSSNLAVVRTGGERAAVECLLRSASEEGMERLEEMFTEVFAGAGAEVSFSGGYPGWRPDPSSRLVGRMRDIYRGMHGREPKLRAVHAGLECGIIGAGYPELEMVSFGPTIRHPHSPDEYVLTPSVGRFWEFLVRVLAGL